MRSRHKSPAHSAAAATAPAHVADQAATPLDGGGRADGDPPVAETTTPDGLVLAADAKSVRCRVRHCVGVPTGVYAHPDPTNAWIDASQAQFSELFRAVSWQPSPAKTRSPAATPAPRGHDAVWVELSCTERANTSELAEQLRTTETQPEVSDPETFHVPARAESSPAVALAEKATTWPGGDGLAGSVATPDVEYVDDALSQNTQTACEKLALDPNDALTQGSESDSGTDRLATAIALPLGKLKDRPATVARRARPTWLPGCASYCRSKKRKLGCQ